MNFILGLPAPVRHLILLLITVVLGWAATDLTDVLREDSSLLGVLLSAALAAILAVVTPLVASYGVGAARARELGARDPRA